jgi:hypothetical protein
MVEIAGRDDAFTTDIFLIFIYAFMGILEREVFVGLIAIRNPAGHREQWMPMTTKTRESL